MIHQVGADMGVVDHAPDPQRGEIAAPALPPPTTMSSYSASRGFTGPFSTSPNGRSQRNARKNVRSSSTNASGFSSAGK